jgi:hypothetical protein
MVHEVSSSRCHRYKGKRKQRRGGRGAHFEKLFHLILSVLPSARSRNVMSDAGAPWAPKKSN